MLVLTRMDKQEVVIGGNIRVVLLTTKAGKARLGIIAPKDVHVYRKEIQERIDQEKEHVGDDNK